MGDHKSAASLSSTRKKLLEVAKERKEGKIKDERRGKERKEEEKKEKKRKRKKIRETISELTALVAVGSHLLGLAVRRRKTKFCGMS